MSAAHDHRGAGIGEPRSNRLAEASTRPRDDCDAVAKIEQVEAHECRTYSHTDCTTSDGYPRCVTRRRGLAPSRAATPPLALVASTRNTPTSRPALQFADRMHDDPRCLCAFVHVSGRSARRFSHQIPCCSPVACGRTSAPSGWT